MNATIVWTMMRRRRGPFVQTVQRVTDKRSVRATPHRSRGWKYSTDGERQAAWQEEEDRHCKHSRRSAMQGALLREPAITHNIRQSEAVFEPVGARSEA